MLKKSLPFPAAVPSGRKKKVIEGSMSDWAPSDMAMHKQMPPDLQRKIAKELFISAEVRQ